MQSKTPRPTSDISEALRHFDDLPDSAFVRVPVVAALFACSNITIWRRSKAGTLPAPRKLSERTTAWNVGEIRQILYKAA
jgi:predicted DNA-binding transcriptional regulator AlpA